jgi:hypothetical protein
MYFVVAGFAKGNLLSIDSGRHLIEGVEFDIKGADVFDVVHFYIFFSPTVSTALPKCG